MRSDLPSSFGEVLQELRKQHKVNQQSLAERLGVHRNTIGAWERGDRLPETRGLVLELAKQLRLTDEETRLLLEASLTGLSPCWSVPYPRNPFFTGRTALLQQLHQQLCWEPAVAVSQSSALSGLGGIGKTQLALEYAYQHAHEYHAIFWVAAETRETLLASFATLAQVLRLPEAGEHEQQKLVEAVLRWLSTHKAWLLIFDNVEELTLLQEFLPPTRQGAILITTRLHALGGLARPLEVEALSHPEALHFLLARANLADATLQLDEMPQEVLKAASALAEATDGLPLALDQAGAYIERTGCRMPAYLKLFQEYRAQLLAERGLSAGHPYSVAQTFLLSFEQVASRNAAAADLLRLCSVLHPDAIPEELIREGAAQWSATSHQVAADPFALDGMIATLLQFSLVKRSAESRTLSLHRLVQAVLWETMDEAERQQWVQRAIAVLDAGFPQVGHTTWQQCERLLPHALSCLERADASHEDLTLASLALKAGQYMDERGRYAEAEPLLQRALRLRERLVGSEHPEVASSLHYLADLYFEQGKYAQAESLFERALRIREQQVGPAYFDVASTLNRLAALYATQGKYAQAEPLFERALRIREQQVGPNHFEVASPLSNLAELYFAQGKYVQAEPLFERALRIREQENPEMARTLNNLANLYQAQGKYAEAEPFYLRALRIWEQMRPGHPEIAYPLNNLAELYRAQGKYAEAEPPFLRALGILEQQVGSAHPEVVHPLNGLAGLYQDQGRYVEAEPLYQRALRIAEQQVEPENLLAALPLHGLAELYRLQGKYAEAEPLYQHALSIREHALELSHPDTADTLHGLASLREAQGNLSEAASLYQRALSIREQVLGPAHAKTSETRERLRAVLLALGRESRRRWRSTRPGRRRKPESR